MDDYFETVFEVQGYPSRMALKHALQTARRGVSQVMKFSRD